MVYKKSATDLQNTNKSVEERSLMSNLSDNENIFKITQLKRVLMKMYEQTDGGKSL